MRTPGDTPHSTRTWIALLPLMLAGVLAVPGRGLQEPHSDAATARELRPFVLRERVLPDSGVALLEGTLDVWEDRERGSGRVIGLHVVVLPARSDDPRPDPLVVLAGGPGLGATSLAGSLAGHWALAERDIVLVDQRGTGASNPLTCALPDDPQRILEPLFDETELRACLDDLSRRADLTRYTTPIAMDDLAQVLDTLGYARVNLFGGSYGSRAALVFMRRHPERVRSAVLMGVAPLSFRNPLHHARSAQHGIEQLLAACEADPGCRGAFPRLADELQAVLERLEAAAARVRLRSVATGEDVELVLSRAAFAEGLRLMMYTAPSAARVPLLVHRAWEGDYAPFVRSAVLTNRALRRQIALGMLLCVTCAEDVARIDPGEVEAATAGTFLGDARVREQMQACSVWPRGEVPADYGEPIRCDVPTLLISGSGDPVTPPAWGEEAARHLPRSLHLVVPGWHGVQGPCVEAIQREFLAAGSAEGLDTSCVSDLRLRPFELPGSASAEPGRSGAGQGQRDSQDGH